MTGCKLIRADNSSESKKGSVDIYYKKFLTFSLVEDQNLNEFVIYEVCIKNKRGYVVLIYTSSSPTQDEFDIFR